MSTRLLINPQAGRARSCARALAAMVDLDVRRPQDAAELVHEARSAAEEGLDRVLVAGGDGTMHHAIRGLAGSSCALGVIPLGSGNDLARALGMPLDPLLAARRAIEARPRSIDLGSIDGHLFAGVAGLGFDGEVARFADRNLRGLPRGPWVYPYAVLRTLAAFRAPSVKVEHESGSFEAPFMLVALANSPVFGGGMRIAPRARIDDGWLDLILVKEMSRLRFLAIFPRVYRGSHLEHPSVTTLRLRRARLSARPGLWFYADGEPVAESRVEGTTVEVLPQALLVAA